MPARERLTGYHYKLLAFLGVAAFFEGYDFVALTQILPNLRADFGLDEGAAGLMVGIINIGTIVAYLLVRKADRWGRRQTLTLTIVGYTVFTVASGLMPEVYSFTICQLIARVFLIGEYCTAMVVAAEEFPAHRRGLAIGLIQGFNSFGGIVCAGVVPSLLKVEWGWGWRTVYFVGAIPLVLVAFARRSLKETKRFEAIQQAEGGAPEQKPLMHIWSTPHAKRLIQLAIVWSLTYLCSNTVLTFWKEFAVNDRGWDDAMVGEAITIAALASMPMILLVGPLIDWLGRKLGGAIIFVGGSGGAFLAFTLEGFWPLTLALVLGIFFISAVLPVLNAYSTELFPTEVRADAYAWANNLIGRIGYVISPIVVAQVAEISDWGTAVRWTAIFPIIAIVLVFLWFPETSRKELEETSAVR